MPPLCSLEKRICSKYILIDWISTFPVTSSCWSLTESSSYAWLDHLQLRSYREDTPSPLYQSTGLFCMVAIVLAEGMCRAWRGKRWPPNIVSIKVYFGESGTSRPIKIKPIQCKTGKELSVASKVFIKIAEGQIKRFKMTQSYWTWMTIIWHMSDFRKLCHWLGSDVLFADHIFALTLTSVRPHMWQGGEKIKCTGSAPENAMRGGDRWW